METDLPQITPNKFCCSVCDFLSSNKKDFTRHSATQKHKRNILETKLPKKPQEEDGKFICETCDKSYCNRSSLWKHNKKCSQGSITNDLVLTLITQNKELQNLLMAERRIFLEQMNEIKGSLNNE